MRRISGLGKQIAKYCQDCGKGTVKPERAVCKHCGSGNWGNSKPDAKEQLRGQMVREAKMMANMEGVESKSDTIVTGTSQDALERLRALVAGAGEHKKWQLRGLHLGKGITQGRTVDEVYTAFLRWAQKAEDRKASRFNVSKAFRRLEAFATFQEQHFPTFFDKPLQLEEKGFEQMDLFVPTQVPDWTTRNGALLWVMNLGGDPGSLQVSDRTMMRWMWTHHLCMLFDETVQSQGAIIVQSMVGMSFSSMMAMRSKMSNVETHLNQMFYGCMPFKMKSCLLIGSPWWMNALIVIMRLFMSKKMSDRIVNTDLQGAYDYLGGSAELPKPLGSRDYVARYASLAERSAKAERGGGGPPAKTKDSVSAEPGQQVGTPGEG